jgi:dihydroorotate dehydrogenase (fumarate)
MPGASPLVDRIDTVLQLEDAGASAIVMHSLFEEQIARERDGHEQLRALSPASAEASSYFPAGGDYVLGPSRYLEHLSLIKRRVGIPVIGSLNGTTAEGWLEFARLIERAGADALELNFITSRPTARRRLVGRAAHRRHRRRVEGVDRIPWR